MKLFCWGLFVSLAVIIGMVNPTCVLESDFGFKINCAFKKSGLFRVRNLGGLKAHASLGFSLGDELGFEQSLTNLDPSRRRSVNVRNGAPPNLVGSTTRPAAKQEKRGKQNRIMMRPMAPSPSRPNHAAMDKLSTLHRRIATTMQPIVVPSMETPSAPPKTTQGLTMAKPIPMGVPAFKPLPPKEDTLKVVPISSTKNTQIPQAKGPGLAYQSENYPQSHNQVSKMVSQMTAFQYSQPPLLRITPTPIIVQTNTPQLYPLPTTVNPFIPMPVAAPPTQALTIIPAPSLKYSQPHIRPLYNTVSVQSPVSNFVDSGAQQAQELANYAYNTKKVDEYNTITGYGDDTALKFDKEDINAKIVAIANAGNISMDAVEAAISLRQQQLLSKYANMPMPTTSTTTTTTTTTTELPIVFQPQPEPEILVATPQKPKRNPTVGKVMNAPREYYPVGYEKNFDDHFQSKVDLPDTDFHCGDQKYFPGLYGDETLGCMVFHVCALTDDGLVMKSFLCPESTLFDQTILKCNWWFYVDCKSTRRLYDTNIPVSKSYQLMKALTFFSSYKKDVQDDGSQPTNPEDVEGIKEAISILENQEQNPNSAQVNGQNNIQIITPQPILDERNNHKITSTENSPVYRATRHYSTTNSTRRSSSKNKSIESSSESKQDITASRENRTNSSESERKYRRRMTLKNTPVTTNLPVTTNPPVTTTTTTTTTQKPVQSSTASVEIIKQEIQPIEFFDIANVQKQKLIEELKDLHKIDDSLLSVAENAAPVRRFYRSSAEKNSKEVTFVNNEKVQIVRPTSSAKLVGDFQTPTAVIAKLDEAIVGRPYSRSKKAAVTIVTPVNHEPYRIPKDQT
ncbi:unnamed protein product [Chilo suppressalis]|uniref:Chitin-binding type-2 domain-containing protein n=1 Tax=Chilo suppressalis TaxID=168631 RepID=A0ABN8L8N5_CHISP|nr:unnamed protein product [Chilo suppressalis]